MNLLASRTRFAWLSLGAAMVTLMLKLAAWWVTGSVGMLSDALETLANFAAAWVALLMLKISALPADDDHAYGHTKAEYFAVGTEGVLIVAAAAGILKSAWDHFWHPQPLEELGWGVGLTGLASVINGVVAAVLFRAGRQHDSVALRADAEHLMTDVWTSVAVVAGVALVGLTGWFWVDPLLGAALSLHVFWAGWKLLRQAWRGLMDARFPEEELAAVREVLDLWKAKGVQYHALRTRRAGARRFMSVHLLVPGAWTVAAAHTMAEEIEGRLRERVPRLTVVTHLEPLEDPASWDDVELDHRRADPVNERVSDRP